MYKYNKNDLDLLAANTNFLRDNLEKVLRLSDVLQHMNTNPLLYSHLAIGGNTPPKSEFNFNALDNLNFSQIKRKLIPVLKKSDKFEFEAAKTEVKTYLTTLMMLNENEKLFIERFNQKIYYPELLFDDLEIVSRIKNHPMAIWKCSLGNF